MNILIFVAIINIMFLVKSPDEFFSSHKKEPYIIDAKKVTLDETKEGRVSHFIDSVRVIHGKTIITGNEGYAYEKTKMAEIVGNVKIDDEGTIITSKSAKYFRESGMAVLVGTVKVEDGKQHLKADSIVYFRGKKTATAWGNVVLNDEEQNTEAEGNYGEYDFVNQAGFMTQKPVLRLPEKNREIVVTGDTLKIKRKENFMSFSGNVKVKEDSITASAGYLEYHSDSERIYLKAEPKIEQIGKSSLSGFSIEVDLKNREIIKTVAVKNAKAKYVFSDSANNIVFGDTIKVFFDKGKTDRIVVRGNAKGQYTRTKSTEGKGE